MALSVKNDDLEEDASGDRKASLKAARGPLLALGATVFSGTSSEFTALGSKGGIPGFQLLFFLRLTQFLTVIVCLAIFRPKLIGENRRQNWLLLLETLIHNLSTALVLLSFTYVYAAPGIAFGIIQGALPLFTAGFIFLKEKIGPIPCCGILISVTGVVLVSIGMATRAVDASRTLVVSILLPVAAAFTKAPDFVLRRAILKDVSGITLYLYVTSLGTVALLILTFACETPVWTMSAEIAGYVAGVGLSQTMVMLFFIAVLKVEKAAIAVGLRTLVIPFTIILDYLILSVVPNLLKWAGLGLVVLGAVVLNAHTYWAHCQEEKRRSFLEKMGISLPESEKK
ncbi:Hypp842 [Branchiostoma lanceolatum]|uniref:Hypp842 protein n=1 Tax=Branchiostoma lanceolatum TaxID=7740 RepID=A0A8J9VCQ7_BRALA|nr:Hypp842 [Branchiostoma lanceolatum]